MSRKESVRWGIVGCGDVTETKSGPGFQKAPHSSLVAVMRRDGAKAADYAKRHGVPKWYDDVDDLIHDDDVDAVYVATPPSAHCDLALRAAAAGKPCLVEKPMAMNYDECAKMMSGFKTKAVPLWVAYYRRTLSRFVKARALLQDGAIGTVTSAHVVQYGPLATGEKSKNWRYDAKVAGAGVFFDLGSHGLDILDYLISPIRSVSGFSVNTGKAYAAEDVTAASFEFESGALGTGIWNFNADHSENMMTFTGSGGEIRCPVFSDTDLVLRRRGKEPETFALPNPPHVHQPLIETIVSELRGEGTCPSTGESGARTSRVMDACVRGYYG